MARVVFTESASRDEASILNDLHLKAGFQTVTKFRGLFRTLYLRLSEHPNSGAPRPLLGDNIRIGIVSPFIVIYQYATQDDCVTVLRIVHGSRQISGALLRGGDDGSQM